MNFVDTHCHIHSTNYKLDPEQVIKNAIGADVKYLVCVGTDVEDSQEAIKFASGHDNCWAGIGIHPHESKIFQDDEKSLSLFSSLVTNKKIVAIGECGLDYFYNHSPKEAQIKLLEYQLDLAQKNNLPMIFHIRSAFDDFWPIIDNFPGIRGVVHSFTAGPKILDKVLSRKLYVGLNGIMTFTKDQTQLEAARQVPNDSIVLETDSPFLSPVPHRNEICEPKYLRSTAEFLANLRNQKLEELAEYSTNNASKLFNLKIT
jgi:TatD DNase family protein